MTGIPARHQAASATTSTPTLVSDAEFEGLLHAHFECVKALVVFLLSTIWVPSARSQARLAKLFRSVFGIRPTRPQAPTSDGINTGDQLVRNICESIQRIQQACHGPARLERRKTLLHLVDAIIKESKKIITAIENVRERVMFHDTPWLTSEEWSFSIDSRKMVLGQGWVGLAINNVTDVDFSQIDHLLRELSNQMGICRKHLISTAKADQCLDVVFINMADYLSMETYCKTHKRQLRDLVDLYDSSMSQLLAIMVKDKALQNWKMHEKALSAAAIEANGAIHRLRKKLLAVDSASTFERNYYFSLVWSHVHITTDFVVINSFWRRLCELLLWETCVQTGPAVDVDLKMNSIFKSDHHFDLDGLYETWFFLQRPKVLQNMEELIDRDWERMTSQAKEGEAKMKHVREQVERQHPKPAEADANVNEASAVTRMGMEQARQADHQESYFPGAELVSLLPAARTAIEAVLGVDVLQFDALEVICFGGLAIGLVLAIILPVITQRLGFVLVFLLLIIITLLIMILVVLLKLVKKTHAPFTRMSQ